ncbi:hypothetical protein OXYTRIMIC_220 [Oxytricha trifallax]|uniref:Uncharacterized protein n=1 Tax=Oxytricha trifallax TaxID=1172189 RepID=A0A073HXD4_9SPIT|nr:hypothetical protein OXYTRIMIC_220 [Oxytricha trifallax]
MKFQQQIEDIDCRPPYIVNEVQNQNLLILNSQQNINNQDDYDDTESVIFQGKTFNNKEIEPTLQLEPIIELTLLNDLSTNFSNNYGCSQSGLKLCKEQDCDSNLSVYSRLKLTPKHKTLQFGQKSKPDQKLCKNQAQFQHVMETCSLSEAHDSSQYARNFIRDLEDDSCQSVNYNSNQSADILHSYKKSPNFRQGFNLISQGKLQQKIKNKDQQNQVDSLDGNATQNKSETKQIDKLVEVKKEQQQSQRKIENCYPRYRPIKIIDSRVESIQTNGRGRPKRVELLKIHWQKASLNENGKEVYEFFDYECKTIYLKKNFPVFYIDYLEKERVSKDENYQGCYSQNSQQDESLQIIQS